MNKLFILSYNETSVAEENRLKTKFLNCVSGSGTWFFITDLVFGELISTSKYAKEITRNEKDPLVKILLQTARNKKVHTIGVKLPDGIFKSLIARNIIKVDDEGNCIDCKKYIIDYENSIDSKIEEKLKAGNVFVLLSDTHLRANNSREYGPISILTKKYKTKSNVQFIRPVKKKVL